MVGSQSQPGAPPHPGRTAALPSMQVAPQAENISEHWQRADISQAASKPPLAARTIQGHAQRPERSGTTSAMTQVQLSLARAIAFVSSRPRF